MEEIRTYIESGILELYVMGELSADEKREVEKMAESHPAVRSELTEIERSVESYARTHAIEPAEHLREKILNGLSFKEENSNITGSDTTAPVETKVISLASRSVFFYKYAFAASLAIVAVSWVALFLLYSRLQDSQQQLAVIQLSNQKFSSRVNYYENQLSETKTELSVLRSPDFKFIKLQGTKNAPAASMLVAFNPKAKEVMIDMTSLKMPENDQQHQYQLWALVDGKPVDLGVFDAKTDSGMIRMKEINKAQAFAVTLEPRGGSVNPTMDQMMVMGAISI